MADAISRFERGFQKMPGNFDSQRIGNHLARAVLVLDPSRMWESDPNRAAIGEKLDVDGIGVARRNGDDHRLINAVDSLFGPAVKRVEIVVHKKTISERGRPGKPRCIMMKNSSQCKVVSSQT